MEYLSSIKFRSVVTLPRLVLSDTKRRSLIILRLHRRNRRWFWERSISSRWQLIYRPLLSLERKKPSRIISIKRSSLLIIALEPSEAQPPILCRLFRRSPLILMEMSVYGVHPVLPCWLIAARHRLSASMKFQLVWLNE
ncbi:MAG: hypothetical protein BWX60_00989 [Candidatus Marinimicrobia bacterium ADurb.Bin030]|nr:MAG: hypothetical protein BWX60_00989 [Candidatus Marinimicrobia bacterium ADurb.Bin030]